MRHTVALTTGLSLFAIGGYKCAADDSIPDMLEKALPGVVTVVVKKYADNVAVKGLVATDVAYQRVLDLGSAGGGSGFVIELNGKKYIVTNAHVVNSASGSGSLLVYSINQSKYEVSLAALDSLYDLALLSFDEPPGSEVAALPFGSAKVRVGQSVYAIGNPLGMYPYSVSAGIIGGMNRRFPDLTGKFGYLQTSATLSHGNSGGPLVASDGQVVGVNTRIEFDRRGRQSFQQTQLNFALEAGLASRIIKDMLANGGRLQRAYLGIEVSQEVSTNHAFASEAEVTLASTLPGSPAAEALGDKIGFTIRKIGKKEVRQADEALEALEEIKPGDMMRMELSAPKSDKVEVVTVKAASLTDDNAAAIGAFALNKHVDTTSMTEKDGGVLLRSRGLTHAGANVALRRKTVSLTRTSEPASSSWLARPPTRVPPVAQIIAVGRRGGGDEDLYRVKNLRDLGIAVKLTALSGEVDVIYLGKDGEPDHFDLPFSGQTDVVRRTLFY